MSQTTAVAARETVRELQAQVPAGTLHPELQRQIEERKLRGALVQQLRGQVWAKEFDANTVRAVAEYAHRYGIDPVTEIEVLGGRIYLSAPYYQRRGAELIQAGVVDRIEQDHVAHDARLETLAKSEVADEAEWARREIARRVRVRIQHGAPEKAAAVVVTRVWARGMTEPIEGCNWCGGGVRQRDPVGEAEPTKTAETRSARRAWKQLVSAVPALAEREAPIHEAGAAVSEVLRTDARVLRTEPTRALAAPDYGDDAGDEPIDVSVDEQGDAYGDEPSLPLDDARPARGRDALAEG